jgi:hypothetical protein
MVLPDGTKNVALVLHRPYRSRMRSIISDELDREEARAGTRKRTNDRDKGARVDANGRANWNTTISSPSDRANLRTNSSSSAAAPTITLQAALNQTYASPTQSANLINSGTNGQARVDSIPLPGKNQDVRKLNMTAVVTSSAGFTFPPNAVASQAVGVAQILPGKNQPKPILDTIAAPSLTELADPQPTSSNGQSSSVLPTSTLSGRSSNATPIIPTSLASFSSTSLSLLSTIPTPASSFVTLTRSQQGKGQAPISTEALSISQASQSLSTTLSSLLVVTSIIAVPTGQPNLSATANAELRQRARLTPLARTLFIVFGALGKFYLITDHRTRLMFEGAVALFIAFGVVVVLQVKKKRAREALERYNEHPFDGARSESSYSATIHISANDTARNSFEVNPYMTESEKAIVARAVTPDEGRDVSTPDP